MRLEPTGAPTVPSRGCWDDRPVGGAVGPSGLVLCCVMWTSKGPYLLADFMFIGRVLFFTLHSIAFFIAWIAAAPWPFSHRRAVTLGANRTRTRVHPDTEL